LSEWGQKVKGYFKVVEGKPIVIFIAKEPRGKIKAGDIVTSILPSPTQIKNYGL
jgi:hypothetical protein